MNAPRSKFAATRRGFASIFAISLIMMVGVTLTVLGTYFAAQATRTRVQLEDAQLRQLLTAGAAMTTQRASTPGLAGALPLPSELTARGGALFINITGEGDERTAMVTAHLGDRRIEQ